jgi:hypothetical protein
MLDNDLFIVSDAEPIAVLMPQILWGQTAVVVIVDHHDLRSSQGLAHQS